MPDSPSSQSRHPGLEKAAVFVIGTALVGIGAAILLGVYALAALVL
jgi:hypothetical protein